VKPLGRVSARSAPPLSRRAAAAQTLTLTVTAPADVSPPASVPVTDGSLTAPSVVTAGKTYPVSGLGYAAGTPVTIAIYPGPSALATATADATGAFRTSVTVQSSLRGPHTLLSVGIEPGGDVRFLESPVDVQAPATDDDTGDDTRNTGTGSCPDDSAGHGTTSALATTGADSVGALIAAAAAIAGGGILLAMTHRRRRSG
jgi:hypothetical protein